MDINTILGLVKAKLGISTTIRDTYLQAIINGVITELEDEQGLVLDNANSYHLIFIVDYSVWRYESKNSKEGIPMHLKSRLYNLILHEKCKASDLI